MKKYKPPTGETLFVRIERNKEVELGWGVYERYMIAICENLITAADAISWEPIGYTDIELAKYSVTHFCVPDPVEIE